MVYADQLLEQARHLAKRERTRPRQASLRRAISTAYYALFHLLIHEATLNWKRADQRALFARFFEHGKMKSASDRQRGECHRYLNSRLNASDEPLLDCMRHLYRVAHTFTQVQQFRHIADYDNSTQWTRTNVLDQITAVETAFASWRAIREEPMAQTYLVSLLGNPRA